MRGQSRIDDRFIVDAGEFDIHRGTGEGDMVDSSGDAKAVGIVTPYFDVVRTLVASAGLAATASPEFVLRAWKRL